MDRGRAVRRRSRQVGLDQPYAPRRGVPQRPDWDPETFGRISERVARFIGSQACRACHEKATASYLRTGMGQSMAQVRPDREPPDATL